MNALSFLHRALRKPNTANLRKPSATSQFFSTTTLNRTVEYDMEGKDIVDPKTIVRPKKPVVTVFGGSGFIGREVVKMLAPHCSEVRVGARDPDAFNDYIRGHADSDSFSNIIGDFADVCDKFSLNNLIEGSDTVINLTGIKFESDYNIKELYVDGVRNVAHGAYLHHVPNHIYVGCLSSDLESLSKMADIKARAEDMSRAAFGDNNILIRPGPIYGDGDQFAQTMKRAALFWPGFVPVPHTNTKIQPTYVQDVAKAILRIVQDPQRFQGRHFQLGGPDIYTNKEFVSKTLAAAGRSRLTMPVPFWLAELMIGLYQWFPNPAITRFHSHIWKKDQVVSDKVDRLDYYDPKEVEVHTYETLGIEPVSIENVANLFLRK